MKMNAERLLYDEIEIGEVYSFERVITRDDVIAFSELIGDRNPLHINEKFGRESPFGKNIVHGMLVAGLFSTLVGMYCPGEKCLYVGQTLQFRSPLYYEDKVEVRGTVMEKNNAVKIIKLKTEVLRGDDLIVAGEARVNFID